MSLNYQVFGDQAILISWPNEISTSTSQDVYFFNQKIQSLIPEYVIETVSAYCSLTVYTKETKDTQSCSSIHCRKRSLEIKHCPSTRAKSIHCRKRSLETTLLQ